MDLNDVMETEFSEDFVEKMKNRMATSYFKYGEVKNNYGIDGDKDAIASLEKRIEKYKETGNTEWLVDVGNFAMIEYMFPSHEDAHFKATDSDKSPGLEERE